jgi:hypothetical protein
MIRKPLLATILLLGLALSFPCPLSAQSDDSQISLGDLARAMRQNKEAQSRPEINNDNFSELMEAAEQNKPWDSFKYSIDSASNSFQVSAPDVTCNLSFNSPATALLSDPFATRSLPDSEVAKLNGPAKIDGDTFEISIYNGSDWTLREVTVALTIVHSSSRTASYGTGKLIPASVTSTDTDQKLSDTTLLFHIKGSAAAAGTAVFQKTLQGQLSPGDDWHWAIVDAKGMPPKADPVLPLTLDPSLTSGTTISPPLPVSSSSSSMPLSPQSVNGTSRTPSSTTSSPSIPASAAQPTLQ